MEKYSDKKSELRFVLPLIIGCVAAILLFHILYWPEFTILLSDGIFLAGWIAEVALFAYVAYKSYVDRDEAEPNGKRWVTLIVAALLCAWVGAWCAQYRADKSDNIHYEYKKP
jgi:hypothetical protein